MNAKCTKKPTPIATAKKRITLSVVTSAELGFSVKRPINALPMLKLVVLAVNIARIIIPIISSSIAAVTIDAPTFPCKTLSSLSTATVIPTDVAVRMTPK